MAKTRLHCFPIESNTALCGVTHNPNKDKDKCNTGCIKCMKKMLKDYSLVVLEHQIMEETLNNIVKVNNEGQRRMLELPC